MRDFYKLNSTVSFPHSEILQLEGALKDSIARKNSGGIWFLALSVIAGGRWLTQIWFAGFPLADLLLQLMVLRYLIRFRNTKTKNARNSFSFFELICLFIFAFNIYKISRSLFFADFSLQLILRDSMFLLVLSIVPLARILFGNSYFSLRTDLKYSNSLALASLFAFITGVLSKLVTDSKGWNLSSPFFDFQAPIFSVRADQLMCSSTFLMLYFFSRITLPKGRFLYVFLLFAQVILLLFLFSSRAVLISCFITFFIGGLFLLRVTFHQGRTWPLIIASISPLALIGALKLPGVGRLFAGLGMNGLSVQSDPFFQSAASTQNARSYAWRLIYDYWKENAFWFGFDPGTHVIQNSGSLRYLSGELEVRWPHNVILSIMFRNGLIFGSLLLACIFYILYAALSNSVQRNSTLLDFQFLAYLVSIFVVSSVGVVLESPFGYVPFTIIAGFVLARKRDFLMKGRDSSGLK